MSLRGTKILITAGPTWVPIDDVRVISNVATGETGALLARSASSKGASVTLLLGPACDYHLNRAVRIVRFRFFTELKNILMHELKSNKYDIIIHSAAVSDFKPERKLKGKLNSNKVYNLRLTPLEKLVIKIRQLARDAKLVMFKLEPTAVNGTLIRKAKTVKHMIGADLIVANRLSPYRAYIINGSDRIIAVRNKQELAKRLIRELAVT